MFEILLITFNLNLDLAPFFIEKKTSTLKYIVRRKQKYSTKVKM